MSVQMVLQGVLVAAEGNEHVWACHVLEIFRGILEKMFPEK